MLYQPSALFRMTCSLHLREGIHKHGIRNSDEFDRASVIQGVDRVCAESGWLDGSVVLETATLEGVLHIDSTLGIGSVPDVSKVLILLQCHEPEIGAKEDGHDGVQNQ